MLRARVALNPGAVVAPVNRRTFGSFVEHLGRCVYTGIYEPGHPGADEDGFRTDVLALARELGVTTIRYPGGNFVSGYRWEDGVGPRDQRPRRRDLAWRSIETNEVGIDEFARWARKADVEIMYAVNLGTRGVQEALDVHEYVNHPEGTALSEQRRANGAEKPYGIRIWCLGNELDGPWQIGHKAAQEYGLLAAATARALKSAEPDLELVVCGSSSSTMPTFGAWESTVLEHAYDVVEYVSCHAYYEEHDGDLGSFLASAVDMDHFVNSIVATADAVGARLKSTRKINLSFDEWNVWYLSRFQNAPLPNEWEVAPRVIEDRYNVADAVVVGNLLISLLRHSDRVTAACQAQLVNVIAPIMTEPGGPAWRQTIFHPFARTAALAKGEVLETRVDSPTYQTARYGEADLVDAVATHDPATGDVTLFVVNRSQDGPVELTVDLAAFGAGLAVGESVTLADDDVRAVNTRDDPERVTLHPTAGITVDGTTVTVPLPRVSWTALRLSR
ncbi:alpha-N-arabinofuranosidase [Actinoplanes sp. SE50]|uniref:arabinosylfuranosidase ArfA n=1 Tax=unclassified Actinoplanes TaxID=2626549 RepID=UPI00023ED6BE|nr:MULTISPECIES: alpha-L-arabinofuranosidase C-terminal domain-containing protein [unclassified Actinoplanes]AEV87896.1 alpha-N-arabinofuranosidase [Actinoplanes sp. SE50/110]ATO86300.1 alpha-N-arabinofuranosidase [Actinoplanes sp. SE50]SLM03715.1 alpha-N-arabinofuranosidase [Actinoplanes sp. SE50/110]